LLGTLITFTLERATPRIIQLSQIENQTFHI
jgi:hypothetical protein